MIKLDKASLLLFFVLCLSCKNYYNDTIDWCDSIKIGATIDEVKRNQPNFFEINWNKPDTVENELRFRIVNIKGNRDILNMDHYLVFINNKFEGRSSYK
ncbi:MAG TPA: hypothetical protein VGQ59_14045 [Cyclobacteriaceae bacterium]|nr:hypothetical protein [Cyclobacteriaceae bacterium]